MSRSFLFRLLSVGFATFSYWMGSWDASTFTHNSGQMLGLGFLAGHLFFTLSLLATTPFSDLKFLQLWRGFRRVNLKNGLHGIWVYGILTSLYEELVWRVSLQSFLSYFWGSWVAIGITSMLFTVVHYHRFKGRLPRVIEFTVFSFALSVIFYVTHSYWIVVMMHFCRNALTVIYRLSILPAPSPVPHSGLYPTE